MKTPALMTLSCSQRSTSWSSSMVPAGRISQTAAGKQQQLHLTNHLHMHRTAADNPCMMWPCNSNNSSNSSHASSGSYNSSISSTCSRLVLT